jgi:hypothetical protein
MSLEMTNVTNIVTFAFSAMGAGARFVPMAVTDQELLDAARQRLLKILDAGVSEFGEGGERARMLEIDKLEKLIANYEERLANAGGARFLPVRFIDQ